MDGWDLAIWIIAGVAATTSLVRLMLARRNKLLNELTERAATERARKALQAAKRPNRAA